MADEKAPAKNHQWEVFGFLIGLFILSSVVTNLTYQYKLYKWYGLEAYWTYMVGWARSWWVFQQVAAAVVSATAIVWAYYSGVKLRALERQEAEIYLGLDKKDEFDGVKALAKKENEKWRHVVTLANSLNSSDWRLAIIEADIMLEDFLRAKGYQGENVGDLLKAVGPGEIQTIENAWEAHKVRNRIAHSGADFELNEREMKRVITLFESVFKEGHWI